MELKRKLFEARVDADRFALFVMPKVMEVVAKSGFSVTDAVDVAWNAARKIAEDWDLLGVPHPTNPDRTVEGDLALQIIGTYSSHHPSAPPGPILGKE